jgi:hypothetical protein
VNSLFLLGALAASKMPREQEIWCRCAAEETVIQPDRSEKQTSNLQIADAPDNCQIPISVWF